MRGCVRRISLPATLAGAMLLSACGGSGRPAIAGWEPSHADPATGARLAWAFGCGTCHVIPGVVGADAHIGPPLTDWSRRSYIAGTLPNEPEQLVRWIVDPQMIEPYTAMPDLAVSEAQARHIAAYLYTLR